MTSIVLDLFVFVIKYFIHLYIGIMLVLICLLFYHKRQIKPKDPK